MCVCESRWVIQYEVRVFTEDNSSGVTTGVCVSVCVCGLQRGNYEPGTKRRRGGLEDL